MQMQPLLQRAFALVAGITVLTVPDGPAPTRHRASHASATPAARSASRRRARPSGSRAPINRPLTIGDRLWVDAGARAEIQVGGAMIRLNGGTAVALLNLDDRIVQLQLTQGVSNVRVRRLASGQVFEVDTPNLAFTLRQPGEYRIDGGPDGNATTIVVRKGQGEVIRRRRSRR